MASWVSDWYFENGFDINGVEFGHREAELVKEIENNNGADNIGITAIFRADGIVKKSGYLPFREREIYKSRLCRK